VKRDSFSVAQDGCDDAGASATVKDGQDKEWVFIRRIHPQKIPYRVKTQRSRSQIGALVAHLREGDQGADRFLDFLKNTVSCAGIVGSDIFPYFV
jgi:hypothetical protein